MAFGVEEKPLQGETQVNGTTNGEATMLPKGGSLNSPSRLSIVCIGAGVSGIVTAIRVQETMKGIDLDVYEKNHDLGGTWLENRYLGCACDVPAHAYIYTFGKYLIENLVQSILLSLGQNRIPTTLGTT